MKKACKEDGRPKEPNPDFVPPAMLSFPAPEIILFFMYYNGVLQASLTIMCAPGVAWPWRLFGAAVCAGVIGIILLMMRHIRKVLYAGHVHGGR